MRRAFAQTLNNLAAKDEKVSFITGDLGFQVFDEFKEQFPGRYINVGVSEAQMVYLAAGMALEGWRPIAYSIASFATGRPFEQLRYCVGYHNLPVVLIGAGRGYLYSTSGVSHHAADDLALMTAIPNMTVVAPGDPLEVEALLPQLLELDGPAYMSVGKYGEPVFRAEESPQLGKARRIQEGEGIAILSTGEIANEVVAALDLLQTKDLFPAAYQFHTVKPLDEELLESLEERFGAVIVVEEHLPQGGLWTAIARWKAERNSSLCIERLGPPDSFQLGNIAQQDLRERIGVSASKIAETCIRILAKPSSMGAQG